MLMGETRFEWDEEKDSENQTKHNVSFAMAQHTFLDPHRVIVEDIDHSSEEERFYCIGRVGDGVIPSGLPIEEISSESMVLDIGEKGGRYMKSKIKYSNKPMGRLKVIKDFLPPPEKLVLKEENVKITIALNKSSIEFFKKEAQRYHTSYQKMIRRLIDLYASQHQKSA